MKKAKLLAELKELKKLKKEFVGFDGYQNCLTGAIQGIEFALGKRKKSTLARLWGNNEIQRH